MARNSSLKIKLGGLGASAFVKSWMGSLDIQAVMYDRTVDPARDDYQGPLICAFWHEYLMTPFFLHGRTNSAILTSRHRDADWLSEAARHMGYDTIRGSTSHGGGRAMLEFIRDKGTRNLGIACDGPKGPRRQLAQGPIYLSSRLQVPLVVYGVGYDNPWRTPTWDRFALPRPGSRSRVIVGPRLSIPPNLNRDQVEHYRLRAENLLLRLTFEAEAWAASSTSKQGQFAAHRIPAHRSNRVRKHVQPLPDGLLANASRAGLTERKRRAA